LASRNSTFADAYSLRNALSSQAAAALAGTAPLPGRAGAGGRPGPNAASSSGSSSGGSLASALAVEAVSVEEFRSEASAILANALRVQVRERGTSFKKQTLS
jgi:hypothetical protein